MIIYTHVFESLRKTFHNGNCELKGNCGLPARDAAWQARSRILRVGRRSTRIGSLMNMFIENCSLMNMFIENGSLMNMFINERFIDEHVHFERFIYKDVN